MASCVVVLFVFPLVPLVPGSLAASFLSHYIPTVPSPVLVSCAYPSSYRVLFLTSPSDTDMFLYSTSSISIERRAVGSSTLCSFFLSFCQPVKSPPCIPYLNPPNYLSPSLPPSSTPCPRVANSRYCQSTLPFLLFSFLSGFSPGSSDSGLVDSSIVHARRDGTCGYNPIFVLCFSLH